MEIRSGTSETGARGERPAISQCPAVLSLPADWGTIFPQAPLRVALRPHSGEGRDPPETGPLEIGQRKPADSAREVAERVAPAIAVGIGVRGLADPDAVEDDDRGATTHAASFR